MRKVLIKSMINKYLVTAVTGTVCLASSVCCVNAAFRPNISDDKACPVIVEAKTSQYEDLYNIVFYSFLYNEFPETKEIDPQNIQEYLDNRKVEGEALASYVKAKADKYIEGIYNYNIVYGKSGISINRDIDAVSSSIKTRIQNESQKAGMSVTEYLKKYYGYTETANLDDIIRSISVFTAYKEVYLAGKAQNISDTDADKYYKKYKNYLDSYTFAYFKYKAKSGEEIGEKELKKRQSKLNKLYEDSHSLEDFETLSTSFIEEYPEGIFKKKRTYSYEQLYRTNEQLLNYIINAAPEKDELCYIDDEGTIYMIYFISRQKNSTACYNGYYIKGEDNGKTKEIYNDMKETGNGIKDIDTKYLTEFKQTTIQEIGFDQGQYDFFKDSPVPFYLYDNAYQRIVYITREDGTWYEKVLRDLYYKDLCEEAESMYIPLAQIYMFKEDFSVLSGEVS